MPSSCAPPVRNVYVPWCINPFDRHLITSSKLKALYNAVEQSFMCFQSWGAGQAMWEQMVWLHECLPH